MSLHITHDSVLGSHTFFLPLLSNCFHCRFAYSEGGLWDLRVDRSIGTAVRNKSWIIMFGIVSLLARSDHNRVDRCLCIKSFHFHDSHDWPERFHVCHVHSTCSVCAVQ